MSFTDILTDKTEQANRHINQINIKNFTCFKDAEAKGLKKINLVVGGNGCGKTYFLNAIDILATKQTYPDATSKVVDIIFKNILDITRRPFKVANFLPPVNLITYFRNDDDAILSSQNIDVVIDKSIKEAFIKEPQGFGNLFFNILYIYNRQEHNEMFSNCISKITANNESEDDFTNTLRLLVPNIECIRQDMVSGLLVQIKGQNMRLPLSSQGYGAMRFALFSALLQYQKNGVFGIDELENGLHYDKYESISENLMLTCLKYNTQLFATTHSCELATRFVDAVQKLVSNGDITEDDFALVYLHRPAHKEGVQAYVVNEIEAARKCIESYRYV